MALFKLTRLRYFFEKRAVISLFFLLLLSTQQSLASPTTGIGTIVDPRSGYRSTTLVHWLEWNSPFRNAGLVIGDRIVGIDSKPLPVDGNNLPEKFGEQGNESSIWRDLGKNVGDQVSLDVKRGDESLTIVAALGDHAAAFRGADGKYRYGNDGPLRQDPKHGNLVSWYKYFRQMFEPYLLPYEWSEFDTRIGRHLNDNDRKQINEMLDVLADLNNRYPSEFTRFLKEIANRAQLTIAGEPGEIKEEQLEWRRLGEIRAQQVADAADAALARTMASLVEQILEQAFPVPDPSKDPIEDYVGKIVYLEPAEQRDVVFEAGRTLVGVLKGKEFTSRKTYFRHSGTGNGVYFTARHTPKVWSVFDAMSVYSKHVIPVSVREATVRVLGKVQPEPALVTDERTGRSQFGMVLDPVALVIESSTNEKIRFFVDLRTAKKFGDVPAFAGEETLLKYELEPYDASTPPDVVFKRFVNAIKYGDYESWKTMFAEWEVSWTRFTDDETQLYEKWHSKSDLDHAWEASRRALLDEVFVARSKITPSVIYDVEVVSQSPVTTIHQGEEQYKGTKLVNTMPAKIEETTLFVRYIGKFDDEYRTFTARGTLGYNTFWRLQRRNGGLWKITRVDAI